MATSRWRIALTGAATIALAVVGVGLVQGAPQLAPADPGSVLLEEEGDTLDHHKNRGDRGRGHGRGQGMGHGGKLLGGWGRLNTVVHGEITVDLPEEGLTTYAIDGGTLSAVDTSAGSISIDEATGETVTIHTNDDTKVRTKARKDHERQDLEALTVGDQVVVVSVEENGVFVARRVIVRNPDAEEDGQPFHEDEDDEASGAPTDEGEEASEAPAEEASPTEPEASPSGS
ncbi:MAG: hypothetical protein ACR2JZ_05835 [Candidatus Limnocylindrales bacterium]